jgi:hypothetical protein
MGMLSLKSVVKYATHRHGILAFFLVTVHDPICTELGNLEDALYSSFFPSQPTTCSLSVMFLNTSGPWRPGPSLRGNGDVAFDLEDVLRGDT